MTAIAPYPKFKYTTLEGIPGVGYLLYTYAAGTTTPLATYQDDTLSTPNTNPVVLNSRGEADVWLDAVAYKFVLKTDLGVTVWTVDDIIPSVGFTRIAEIYSDFANTSNVEKGDALIGVLGSGNNEVATTVHDTLDLLEFRFCARYGGKNTNNPNDAEANHAAMLKMCTDVMTAGGGKIIIEHGTYYFGIQDFAGNTGLGYAYKMRSMLSITGCTKPVIIELQSAIFKVKNGIKYGSYDPVTGSVYIPASLPFTNGDYRADAGSIIDCYGNSGGVIIQGSAEIDGNSTNAQLGGQWGDTGYQIVGYGIRLYTNAFSKISDNIYVHHCCIDNIIVDSSHNYTDNPNILIGLRAEYGSRQGLSLVGGHNTILIACKLNYTGKGAFSSAPGAGFDIESEQPGGEDPVKGIRRVYALQCEFIDNTGASVVADSGSSREIVLDTCRLIGVSNYALWANKPNFKVFNSFIFGGVSNTYTGTLLSNCVWTDSASEVATLPTYGIDSYGAVWEDCEIYLTRLTKINIQNATLRRCKIYISVPFSSLVNQDWVINFTNSTLEDCEIYDRMTGTPLADGVFVITAGIKAVGRNYLESASNKLKWNSWSAGAGGFKGYFGDTIPQYKAPYVQVTARQVIANGLRYDNYNGVVYTWQVDSIPTTGMRPDGTNQIGDRFVHCDATVGQPKAWYCTVAGNPGTLTSEGNL